MRLQRHLHCRIGSLDADEEKPATELRHTVINGVKQFVIHVVSKSTHLIDDVVHQTTILYTTKPKHVLHHKVDWFELLHEAQKLKN